MALLDNLYNADNHEIAPGTPTHPYDHASKLFIADNLKLAPKQSFLYYVCINIGAGGFQSALSSFIGSSPESSQSLIEQYEAGLMAKRVDLPKFTLNNRTLNAYNRKNIVQTHIQYDPITITFHDDSADTVLKFWNDYYTYYYRDSDYKSDTYQTSDKYSTRANQGWGYTPRNKSIKPFLRNIQIFSLHNKRFTEYLLVNPYITSWRHGEHSSADGSGIMEASMTLAYETVKYRTGFVNAVDVNGFATLHYDNVQSPISNSKTNINGDGILGVLTGGPTDLARPDGTAGGAGLLGSLKNAKDFIKAAKNANLKGLVLPALGSMGISAISGGIDGAFKSVMPGGISVPTSLNGIGAAASGAADSVKNFFSKSTPTAPEEGTLTTAEKQASEAAVTESNRQVENASSGGEKPPIPTGDEGE